MDEQHFCGCTASMMQRIGAWSKRRLLVSIQGQLPALTAEAFRAAVSEALASWQAVCPMTFEDAAGRPADLILTAARIDGPAGVLAWSELPDGTDRPLAQRYDTSERFVNATRPGPDQIDIVAVVCHEVGHALGLDHAPQGSADLMAPVYTPGRRTPQPGDVARIRQLYGAPADPGDRPPIVIRIYNADRIEIPGYRVTKEP